MCQTPRHGDHVGRGPVADTRSSVSNSVEKPMTFALEPAAVLDTEAEVPLWIGGRARVGSATVVDRAPATDDILATVHLAGEDEVDAAIGAAVEAQRDWSRVALPERATRVRQLGDRILEHADELGLLDAHDTGTPIRTMRAGARKGATYLHMAAGVAIQLQGHTIPASGSGWHLTLPRPLGVVAGIAAFNHPTLFTCQKIGPPLIAGNAVVLKPAEQAPISAVMIAAMAEDLFPAGLLNVLAGEAAAGQRLVAHPDVAAITFTGGVPTGLKVQQAAAASGRFKKLVLELGGKNPILVFPDTDVDEAAAAVVRGMNYTRNQGQSCGSTSRLVVHRDVHHDVVDRVVEQVARIKLGLPEREDTEMGSLISKAHRDRNLSAIERAQQQGAKLLVGGHVPQDRPELAAGAYLEPTVFDAVTPDMAVAQEELFGPVLAVMRCDDDAEMIRVANDTEYGLTAAIWTQDIDRALRAAERIEAGYVWINDVETRYPGVPHGGWKQSGIGVEQALTEELLGFTRSKSINIAVRGG